MDVVIHRRIRRRCNIKLLAVDQSYAKCAFVIFEDNVVVKRGVIRTSIKGCDKGKEGINYFKTRMQCCQHIASVLLEVFEEEECDEICYETLSMGSFGNQTNELRMLFCIIRDTFFIQGIGVNTVGIASAKKTARSFLEADRESNGKLVKMSKGKMATAFYGLPESFHWIVEGYTLSGKKSGKEDLIDATFIGLTHLAK